MTMLLRMLLNKNMLYSGYGVLVGALFTNMLLLNFYKKKIKNEVDKYMISEVQEIQPQIRVPEDPLLNQVTSRYSGYSCTYPIKDKYIVSDDFSIIEYRNIYYQDEPSVDRPFIILPSQFYEEYSQYSKVSLRYFDDGTLEFIDGDTIEDEIDLVDIHWIFGELYDCMFNNDCYETVYVRNHKVSTDYEVLKMQGVFYENDL